jgi:hypothetical protein
MITKKMYKALDKAFEGWEGERKFEKQEKLI